MGSGLDLAAGVAGGVVATVTMDVAMVLAAMLAPGAFASEKNSPEVIGRWAAGLCRGRGRHEDISAETPVRGELWIGLAAHYVTGITLTTGLSGGRPAKRTAAGPGGRHRLRARDLRASAAPHVPLDGLRPGAGGGAATPAGSCARCSSGTRRSASASDSGRLPDEGDELPPHAAAVVRVAGVLLAQPRLFAAALGVQEHRRRGQRDERDR